MLADNPHVLQKLRAEILATVGSTRAPTSDDFRDMKYLRAVFNGTTLRHPFQLPHSVCGNAISMIETLRMYPPV
jgi:cytochrome P450